VDKESPHIPQDYQDRLVPEQVEEALSSPDFTQRDYVNKVFNTKEYGEIQFKKCDHKEVKEERKPYTFKDGPPAIYVTGNGNLMFYDNLGCDTVTFMFDSVTSKNSDILSFIKEKINVK
jgi:hypothetical protein